MTAAANPHASGARTPNRLADTSSPYLLQHRFNPVDWYPWGEAAFAEARRRDVPIFLSIGYSTCYWCHVMERESFESDAIAAIMNRDFVCIKVDREERPDVDDLYMSAVQAFSGRGGWPMSVFLEPHNLKPFWAGTYFPAEPKFSGVPTFPQVLASMSRAWREQRDDVLHQAQELADAVRERTLASAAPTRLSERTIQLAAVQLIKLHDPAHGGFGPAPKFPQPVFLDLLMGVRSVAADEDTRAAIDSALRTTLDAMALGGIFDHVAGGFHRYSVDERWLVPHFEKMLYDNGQLLSVYARAAALYSDPFYALVASRIIDHVLRDMLAPDLGAFFSALDAEVNHREGQNYLWTREQFTKALQPADVQFAFRLYGLDSGPNFRDPHHPSDQPANVLFLAARPAQLAAEFSMDEATFLRRLSALNDALLAARSQRDQPSIDTKILAGWNALMISGLADASRFTTDPRALPAAKRAARAVLSNMLSPSGELFRCFAAAPGREPAPHTPAFLEDYALFARALLALAAACRHAADPDADHFLASASRLISTAERLFSSPDGRYFDTRDHQPDLFLRARGIHDGAMPSACAVMMHALLDLASLTGDPAHAARAARCLRALSGSIAQAPLGSAASLVALINLLRSHRAEFDQAFALLPDTGDAAHADPEFSPVEVFAEGDAIELTPDQPATIMLKVQIAPGYHITAADPGDSPAAKSLVPLRVHIVGGSGVRVYADYPAGQPHASGDDLVLVHFGEVELQAVLERDGEWSGTPLLAVSFQACTDRECLRPRTVELDVTIERA